MREPHTLSAVEASAFIRDGTLTAEALTASCLERIEAREQTVQAWAFIEPELALRQARERDRERVRGPLHGLPVGVKDIIDTGDMPAAYGSPIYRSHRPSKDADCVARARRAGAVILGKTYTTEFAWTNPAPTRNPHDPAHTPGGSSSGSAAGVADMMMPLAIGTQTGGSVVRPSSFCGIVGFKPTFGRYGTAGMKPLAPATDTVGIHARTVDDIVLFDAALAGEPSPSVDPVRLRRVGLCRTPNWSAAEPATEAALAQAAAALRDEGVEIVDEPTAEFADLADLNMLLMRAQAVQSLKTEWASHRDSISDAALKQLEFGAKTTDAELRRALELQQTRIAGLDWLLAHYDALLTPSAPGEAPLGLSSTGNSIFNRPWSTCHVPCITLPIARGPKGLPVGVQLVARRGADRQFLAHALHAAKAFGIQ